MDSSLSIKRLSYLILVALAVYLIKPHFYSSQSYWLIWSALILSLITSGDSFKRRITMIVITGLTAAFACFIAGCLTPITILLGIYLFIITLVCAVASQLYPRYFFPTFIINLFVILSSTSVSFAENTERFVFISIGVVIAAVLQIIFYPYFIRNERQSYLLIALRSLKKLNNDIFSCLLEPAYSDNIYLFERRLHASKNQFIQALSRLREVTQLAETKLNEDERAAHEHLLLNLDLLFENMLDYSQLRRRVTDYTTLSLCSQELKNISLEIDKSIDGLINHVSHKKFYPNLNKLTQYVNQLESHYHHVLQIASREPLVFLLFIDSLNAFIKRLDELYSYPALHANNLS
jgi:uncharacterized membrane protein YgaE (UPF0421/DUF939 family)